MLYFEHSLAFAWLFAIPLFFILRALQICTPVTIKVTMDEWNGGGFKKKYMLVTIIHNTAVILCIIAFIAVVIASASPILSKQEKIYTSRGAETVFVVDISPSMAALDMYIEGQQVNRLYTAQSNIEQFVNAQQNGSWGLVATASEAAFLVPATVDRSIFLERLFSLRIGELGDGSAIGEGLAIAAYHMISSEAPQKAIVLLTDGENNAGSIHPNMAARIIANNSIMLYVVGIGTRGSVALEYTDPTTGKIYSGFFDSRFDEEALRSIAQAGGGSYFYAENPAMLSRVFTDIGEKEQTVQSFYYKTEQTHLHQPFIITALLCSALAWFLKRIVLKEKI